MWHVLHPTQKPIPYWSYISESSSCYHFSPSIKFWKRSGSADQLSMRTRGGIPLDIIRIRNLPFSGSTGWIVWLSRAAIDFVRFSAVSGSARSGIARCDCSLILFSQTIPPLYLLFYIMLHFPSLSPNFSIPNNSHFLFEAKWLFHRPEMSLASPWAIRNTFLFFFFLLWVSLIRKAKIDVWVRWRFVSL